MVSDMGDKLESFRGAKYWVWCFAHIINLVAQTLTCLFDVKGKGGPSDKELQVLAEGLEIEEALTRVESYRKGVRSAGADDNEEVG